MTRRYRRFVLAAMLLSAAGHTVAQTRSTTAAGAVQVFKRPGCGCCESWAQHMRAAGFLVSVAEARDFDAMKRRNRIPPNLESCHTSVIGQYKIEGHVPIDVVQRLLKEKPQVLGIAVPGMPSGSPGMESAVKDSYDVIAFDAAGRQRVYASIKGNR